MLIARFHPETFELVRLIRSFGAFRREFPHQSWVDPVTNDHLIQQGIPARLVTEVPGPTLNFGQDATSTAQRQGDGSWLQVWTVTTRELAALKAEATARANQVASEKISTLEIARGLARAQGPQARPRTVAVLTKLDEILGRIDAAADGPAIRAIMDELEAF